MVFKRLRVGARSVGELAAGMDVSRPAVSQHLKIPECSGTSDGPCRGHAAALFGRHEGIEAVRNWLDEFWDETLMAFKPDVGR